MRIIGLDIGEKRIGVAVADTTVKIASPHSTIVADGAELDQIKKLMSDEGTSLIVVGLPRNSQGLETAQSEIVRLFATKLQSRGARIKFQDESLTSVTAERRLRERKKPYKKEEIDAEAATIILQDFIEGFNGRTESIAEKIQGKTFPERARSHDSEKNFSLKLLIVSTLVIILVSALSFTTIWFTSGTTPAKNTPLRQPFVITTGESTQQIADNLADAHLIKDPTVFTLVARLTSANIPAKTYFISPSENIWQILDQLTGK